MHAWMLLAWHALEGLAATFAPYAFLAAVVCLLAVGRVVLDAASPKSYANEQRIDALVAASLPAAVQPGSIPPVAEDWHDFPAGVNGWGIAGATTGWKKYRLLAEGSVEVAINLTLVGTKADNTLIWSAGALPSGYQPVLGGKYVPASLDTSGAVFYAGNHTPYLVFRTDGSVACFGVNAAGLNQLQCNGIYSLI